MLTEHFVGIDSRVEETISYLGIGLTDVRMLGICGMTGIGKTTIARVVYNRLSDQFEGSCFLANVSEVAKKNGLFYLQKTLLSEILNLGVERIDDEELELFWSILRRKRILLVLDDVSFRSVRQIGWGAFLWFR